MEQIQILQLSLDDFKEMLSNTLQEHLKGFEKGHPEELLTRKEVASRLNISLPTLHKYSELGILKPLKIGERVYHRWSDVLAAAKKVETIKTLNS